MLITLAIIGVVAALTIPTVVQNYRKKQTVVQLKKVYTTLSNTTNLIIAENGNAKGWAKSSSDIYELYKPKLKLAKDCGANAGCMSQTPINGFEGTGVTDNWDKGKVYSKAILVDGTQIAFLHGGGYNPNSNGSTNVLCRIFVDLNGIKLPNRLGRDVFEFVLKDNRLEPAGCDIDNLCDPHNGKQGYACACRVIKENAINY